jgi:MFS family permease
VSRTLLSPVPTGRAVLYAAVVLEGAVVVTFFVAVQLLLNRHYYALSTSQYGAVYVPVFAAAVLAALFAVWGSRAGGRGRVFRLGLTLSAVGRVAMIPTIAVAVRHAAAFFPDLVIIGALTGAGFALVYSAATAFALDIDPARPERQLLRLTLALAAGMVVGPLLQIGVVEAGLWWVVPVIFAVFAGLLIAVSPRSRLGPDAARTCALRNPAKRIPARVKVYLLVAFLAAGGVVFCVAWSQASMIGPVTARISTKVLGLATFWAALTVLARAAFTAIDLHSSWRRQASLGLFLMPAVVTVIGLATWQAETAVVGIFLLAAVVCAAFLPPASQLTERQLVVLPLVVMAGVIGIYPVAIALARPSLSAMRGSGAPLPMIFAIAGVVAILASLGCARLIAFRPGHVVQGGTSVATQHGATQSGTPAAAQGATVVDQHLLVPELQPPYARPCTAVGLPCQKTGSHEDEAQPGAQSEPPRPKTA